MREEGIGGMYKGMLRLRTSWTLLMQRIRFRT